MQLPQQPRRQLTLRRVIRTPVQQPRSTRPHTGTGSPATPAASRSGRTSGGSSRSRSRLILSYPARNTLAALERTTRQLNPSGANSNSVRKFLTLFERTDSVGRQQPASKPPASPQLREQVEAAIRDELAARRARIAEADEQRREADAFNAATAGAVAQHDAERPWSMAAISVTCAIGNIVSARSIPAASTPAAGSARRQSPPSGRRSSGSAGGPHRGDARRAGPRRG